MQSMASTQVHPPPLLEAAGGSRPAGGQAAVVAVGHFIARLEGTETGRFLVL